LGEEYEKEFKKRRPQQGQKVGHGRRVFLDSKDVSVSRGGEKETEGSRRIREKRIEGLFNKDRQGKRKDPLKKPCRFEGGNGSAQMK